MSGAAARSGRALRVMLAVLALFTVAGCDDGVLELGVVMGGVLEVPAGSERAGWLVLLDGEVHVAAGGRLTGTLLVLGGEARLDGRVDGNVVALSGSVALGADASVGGDLAVAGALDRDPGAAIAGSVTVGPAVPEAFAESVRSGPSGLGSVLARAATLAVLALLAGRFTPRAVDRVVEVVGRHALTALALGVLAFVVGLVLVVVMAFTVVLLPVSALALVVGVVAVMVGWSALGIALGTRVARSFAPPGGAGPWALRFAPPAGVFVVVVVLGLLERVPVAGALLALAATAVGLGAVLLTGFGTRRFVPDPDHDHDTVPYPGPGAG